MQEADYNTIIIWFDLTEDPMKEELVKQWWHHLSRVDTGNCKNIPKLESLVFAY